MITSNLTNLYLKQFDFLHDALCFCWHSVFCKRTKQLDKTKLKENIRSYGIYNHENAIKIEEPNNFKDRPLFKTLTWVNVFTNNEVDLLCKYIELYKQTLKEIENNLFRLKNKHERIAYANIILRDLDKSYYHNQTVTDSERNNRCKEFFEFVLNRQFIFENEMITNENDNNINLPNYNLSVRLINHLDFVDRLIEIFSYFEIDLLALADKYRHNLYLFNENICNEPIDSASGTSIEIVHMERNNINFQNNVLPKFNSTLSDDCLIKIMQYLINKKKLDSSNTDVWLFWFNRKYVKVPEPLKWKGSPSMLSNIIQHMCGESISSTIKTAFCTKEYFKPTKCKYEHSKTHKEIEQIITISKQKNN